MYYTYILKSIATEGAIYIGSTSDLNKRLEEHNSGSSTYTNKHKPWQLETYIAFHTQQDAENFEKYLKSNSGKAFLLKRLVSPNFKTLRNKYKNGRAKELHNLK